MAWEQVSEAHEWAERAGADLSAKVFYLAKMGTDGRIVLAAAGTDVVLGPIREGATENNPVTVQFSAVGKCIAGGTITAGDKLVSDGNGKAIAGSAGNYFFGIAAMAADADEIFSFLFVRGQV